MPSYDHIYVLFVLVKSSPFTGFFKWVTWRWSKNCFTFLKLLNSSSVHDGCHWWSKNCFTLLKQLNSSSVFSCISSYSIFNFLYSIYVDNCLSIPPFSFGHCIFCTSIFEFRLLLWYFQTFLPSKSALIISNTGIC